MIFIVSVLNRANNFWNSGNGRGVRTCTSVLRLLGCYLFFAIRCLQKGKIDPNLLPRTPFRPSKKIKKFYDLKLKGNGGY